MVSVLFAMELLKNNFMDAYFEFIDRMSTSEMSKRFDVYNFSQVLQYKLFSCFFHFKNENF